MIDRDRLRTLAAHVSEPTPIVVVVALVVFLVADRLNYRADSAAIADAFFDEPAHLLTGFLVLAALFRGAKPAFSWGLLIASVILDIDHIPQYLGDDFLTRGTSRPYTHSWVTPAACLLIALLWPRSRQAMLGAFVGLVFHLWRDMAEKLYSGVALEWPFSDHSFEFSHTTYVYCMIVIAAVAFVRALLSRRARRAAREAPPPLVRAS